jgi:hypothetical protein
LLKPVGVSDDALYVWMLLVCAGRADVRYARDGLVMDYGIYKDLTYVFANLLLF